MINIIKTLLLCFVFSKAYSFSESDVDPESAWAKSIISLWWWDWFEILDNIFDGFTEYIFAVIALIIIGVFIYVWYLFITSDWDEAQFKKAWKTFIYAVIWIVVIILSWWAVKLVTSVWI